MLILFITSAKFFFVSTEIDLSDIFIIFISCPSSRNLSNSQSSKLSSGVFLFTDLNAINYDFNSVYDNNLCIYSDINEDGSTDINDIIFLLNMILNSELEESADLNSDENIDILDIIQLVNILLNN